MSIISAKNDLCRLACLLSGTLVFLVASVDVVAAPPDKAPDLSVPPGGLAAGLEVMAIVDFLEVESFNEGVMENPSDQVRRTHEPARSEKWKFGETFERFSFSGRVFSGLWRSASFQDQYFIEFIRVEGELAPDYRTVSRMKLTRTRFDRTSLEPPVNRGYTVVSLRFENLQYHPGLGNSFTFRFVPGKSRVFIDSARASFVETRYHSEVRIRWNGIRIDEGKNPVSGIPYVVFADVSFQKGAKPVPRTGEGRQPQTVTVVGDWPGNVDLMKWLSGRGVKVIDRTCAMKVEAAEGDETLPSDEGDAAASGLQESPAVESGLELPREDLTKYQGIVVEVIRTGSEKADLSARARILSGNVENELWLNLDYGRFKQFEDDELADWVRLQVESFNLDLHQMLIGLGL